MPLLQRIGGDAAVFPLLSFNRVGRDRKCEIALPDVPQVSQHHAVLRWSAAGWQVIDNSRNGTNVNGAKLRPSEPEVIGDGARLVFGADACTFVLVGDGPPPPAARSGDDLRVGAAEELRFDGEVRVARDARGRWVAEAGPLVVPVTDGQDLEVGGRRWVLDLPEVSSTVHGELPADEAGFSLRVVHTRDEDHVEAWLVRGEQRTLLRTTYNDLLLALARARVEDAEFPEAERGWREVDDVCRKYRVDRRWVNVAVGRLRERFRDHGVGRDPFARRGTQLRLELGDVRVAASGSPEAG